MGIIKYLFLILLFVFNVANADEDCDKWFKQAKVSVDKNCLFKCTTISVDMKTFTCPNECERFCNSKKQEKYLFEITKLYAGLTASERALVAQEPEKSLKAYKLSWDAIHLCSSLYKASSTNDESDACRHFVWANMLTNEFGRDFSEKLLYAHEQEPDEPEAERAMDLANNQRGISTAERLLKDKKYSESEILEEFKTQLKERKLIVLKKLEGK